MTRDGMDLQPSDDMDLLVEVVAPCRGEFWEHRNVYDGNGEYEFPIAHHYVPRSAHALRPYNHWHFGKLRKYSASAADRHPLVEKNLQGAPHRHPADDQHALSENIRSAVIAERSGQFPQQHAAKQEAKADEQRDAAIAEQQP